MTDSSASSASATAEPGACGSCDAGPDDLPTRNKNQWTAPCIEARPSPEKGTWGIYARERIPKGTVVLIWGGRIITEAQLPHVPARDKLHCVQIEEGIYLGPVGPPEPADFANHSCDPNVGIHGQVSLAALRDIEPGEEICFDYAMTDCTPYDEFRCGCGTARCRIDVTGQDWRNPELWERYAGHFAPHIQRRIDRLRRGEVVE